MLTLSRHFLCSILIDRYLVTSRSTKLRQLSSFELGKWFISLSILCWIIFYSHIWVDYEGSQPGSACKKQPGGYTLFVTICSITIDAIIPIILMIIFSLLTLNNLRGLNQRRKGAFQNVCRPAGRSAVQPLCRSAVLMPLCRGITDLF
jgi:hypothetical protein